MVTLAGMKEQKLICLLAVLFCFVGAANADVEAEIAAIKNALVNYEITLSEIKTSVASIQSSKNALEGQQLELKATFDQKINESKTEGAFNVKQLKEIYDTTISNREADIDEFANEFATSVYQNNFYWLKKNIQNTLKLFDYWFDGKLTPTENSLNLVSSEYDAFVEQSKKVNKDDVVEKLQRLEVGKEKFYHVNKQIQHIQFHEEEKQRSNGKSGIKQIRSTSAGRKNYYSNTHSEFSFASIHDHSNNIRTVGMGEFIAVLNGIEFRTRHNDYRLNQPASTDVYEAYEKVNFPDVPPEVLNKPTVQEQIVEMKEWFKAFKDQDFSKRDYRKYFKPILVYLEGAWTIGKQDGSIDEPFDSDRHHIDATSWFDLQEKIRFTSYTGTKSTLENFAHLPTKVVGFKNKRPILAQWNYRLMCHELKFEEGKTLPLNALKLDLDLANQMGRGRSDEVYKDSRAAKFNIEGITVDQEETNEPLSYSMLDSFMEQIPGLNNYNHQINLTEVNNPNSNLYSSHPSKSGELLNAAYYHRTYQTKNSDGSFKTHQRGFSDRLYVAHNTQRRIAGFTYNSTNANGDQIEKETRVSYAEPAEIIYLTPLHRWNPYNIPFEADASKVPQDGSFDSPLLSVTEQKYYRTPDSFFSFSSEDDRDPADTTSPSAKYASVNGIKYPVRASGVHIFLPEILGVGKVRIRYPIMPIHGEGNAAWKRLNALEDIMKLKTPKSKLRILVTGLSLGGNTTQHSHVFSITNEQYDNIMQDLETLEITTNTANAHVHVITLKMKKINGKKTLTISFCDGEGEDEHGLVCADKHINTVE